MKKIKIAYAVMWVAALMGVFLLATAGNRTADTDPAQSSKNIFLKGTVVKVDGNDVLVKIPSERLAPIETKLDENYFNNEYRAGDTVTVYRNTLTTGEQSYNITDYYHLDGLFWVFLIFVLLTVAVARKKGLASILSVMISLLFFYTIILQSVKAGFPMLTAGVIYILLITVLTIPLIHGFNGKSLSAIIAVNAGYAIGFGLTLLFTGLIGTGVMPTEEFKVLVSQFPDVNIFEILLVSLFLGTVGALIDVAVTISSAIFETMRDHPQLSFKRAYEAGMNVGKDILGSMINTLLIAYMATALPFLVLLTLSRFGNLSEFLNYDIIALELARIFIGAAAIVALIPISSVISAYLITRLHLAKRPL